MTSVVFFSLLMHHFLLTLVESLFSMDEGKILWKRKINTYVQIKKGEESNTKCFNKYRYPIITIFQFLVNKNVYICLFFYIQISRTNIYQSSDQLKFLPWDKNEHARCFTCVNLSDKIRVNEYVFFFWQGRCIIEKIESFRFNILIIISIKDQYNTYMWFTPVITVLFFCILDKKSDLTERK